MKAKSTATKRKKQSAQSVDGILPSNHSYQPSGTIARPSLGELGYKMDGFYPQRATNELGRAAGAAAITSDQSLNEVLSDASTQPKALPEADAKKRRRLPHLRLLPRRRKARENKQRTRKQKILRRSGIAAIILAIAVGGYFGFKFWQSTHGVFHSGGTSAGLSECKDINQLKKEGDCRINVLLLGIGGPGHDGPDLTDTIMLASIDPINNSVALLSIPRDLWVEVPGYGPQKINQAYYDGKTYSKSKNLTQQKRDGLKLLDETLQPIIGLNINYHVIVDFAAFKGAVNDLGGVSINVTSDELNFPFGAAVHTELYDPTIAWENNNNPVIAKKGLQTMNGQQALLFARSRETSSDFARSQRQRAIMVAIGNKVLSLGTFSNPVRISQLLTTFGSNVFTDLSLGNVKPLYSLGSRIPSQDITSLDLATIPGNLVTTGSVGAASVVLPTAGLFNYSQILPYVRASLRDGYLAKENAQVEVYNATSASGVAAQTAQTLRSFGYRVTTVDSAPHQTDPATTTLVDLSGGSDKYTRHYLEMRFKTSAVTTLPSEFGIKPKAGADFVIILGQDASASTTATPAN